MVPEAACRHAAQWVVKATDSGAWVRPPHCTTSGTFSGPSPLLVAMFVWLWDSVEVIGIKCLEQGQVHQSF